MLAWSDSDGQYNELGLGGRFISFAITFFHCYRHTFRKRHCCQTSNRLTEFDEEKQKFHVGTCRARQS